MVAKLARACDEKFCSHLLVRGDTIEFVSVEQARAVGCVSQSECPTALSEEAMPSDIKLPPEYVLVHDTQGILYDRCMVYVLRWRPEYDTIDGVDPGVLRDAKKYFRGPPERFGSVQVPEEGPWRRVARVQHIRYRRHGHARGFEHHWHPPVWLEYRAPSDAWRVPLRDGCVVNDHGFIKP